MHGPQRGGPSDPIRGRRRTTVADPTRWHELMAVFANSGQKGASGLLVTVPSPEEVTAPRWTRAYWNYWAAFPWTAMKTWKYSDGKFFTLQRQAGIGLADGENDLDRDGGPWPNFNMGSAHLLGALGGAAPTPPACPASPKPEGSSRPPSPSSTPGSRSWRSGRRTSVSRPRAGRARPPARSPGSWGSSPTRTRTS